MNIKEAKEILLASLKNLYEGRESASITELVLENITGLSRSERLTKNNQDLSEKQQEKFQHIFEELQKSTPVQYVLGECWFYNRKFKVGPGVLIPRPETEELVQLIIKDNIGKNEPVILDIGTGSGNIPVTLALELNAKVYSCDISNAALSIATENIALNKAFVNLINADVLNEEEWNKFPKADIIVSNPPYVSIEEKDTLDKHVIEFEPESALFAPGNDALIFYKKIALLGIDKLLPAGIIYTEINSLLSKETLDIFLKSGYSAELLKDFYGNNRFIKAKKSI